MVFEIPVWTSGGELHCLAEFEEDYPGYPPNHIYVKQQTDEYWGSLQEVAHHHGFDVHVHARYLDVKLEFEIGIYKHDGCCKVINGSKCYHLVLWQPA